MNWAAIATAAVGILTSFVTKAGEKVSERAGEALFKLVRSRLENDKEAQTTLENFEKNPKRHGTALADIVREKAEDDPEGFGEALRGLLGEIADEAPDSVAQIARGKGIAQAAGTGASASVSLNESDLS